jgi:hypothetical protein
MKECTTGWWCGLSSVLHADAAFFGRPTRQAKPQLHACDHMVHVGNLCAAGGGVWPCKNGVLS